MAQCSHSEKVGVTAEWVDSGQKAIEQVRKLHEAGKYYDMILIDWKMPDMDGIETARRIRADAGPEVTIIIMTAYDWSNIEHEARMAGVNLLMSKPMFKSSLISAFSRGAWRKRRRPGQRTIQLCLILPAAGFCSSRTMPSTQKWLWFCWRVRALLWIRRKNGLRAIEMFSKSEAGSYDAVLMDIRMPQMDGLTAANNIRHMTNADAGTIPIIAMTANAFDEDVEKSKAAGMNAHLAKPIEPERLFQVLHDFYCGTGE